MIDVAQLIESGLIKTERLMELFSAVETQIYRNPSVDRQRFRRAVESVIEHAVGKPPSD